MSLPASDSFRQDIVNSIINTTSVDASPYAISNLNSNVDGTKSSPPDDSSPSVDPQVANQKVQNQELSKHERDRRALEHEPRLEIAVDRAGMTLDSDHHHRHSSSSKSPSSKVPTENGARSLEKF